MKSVVCLALLLGIIFLSFCCRKDKPSPDLLPAATQTRQNTFGCKVNGIPWLPYYKCGIFTNPCGEMQTTFHSSPSGFVLPLNFSFGFQRKQNDSYSSFIISTLPVNQFSLFKTGNIFDSIAIEYRDEDKLYASYGYQNLFTDPHDYFTISKLDTINKIISGTFGFILRYGSDSIVIFDGRFDFSLDGICKCSHE